MDAVAHDTIRVTSQVRAPAAAIWAAYVDVSRRARWSVPDGEQMVYDHSDFREGGNDRYRCGPPGSLHFHARVEYVRIEPNRAIVYAETVTNEGNPLASALVTWELRQAEDETVIEVTSQVASFVGAGMIDGHRNGHAKALEQLRRHLAQERRD